MVEIYPFFNLKVHIYEAIMPPRHSGYGIKIPLLPQKSLSKFKPNEALVMLQENKLLSLRPYPRSQSKPGLCLIDFWNAHLQMMGQNLQDLQTTKSHNTHQVYPYIHEKHSNIIQFSIDKSVLRHCFPHHLITTYIYSHVQPKLIPWN